MDSGMFYGIQKGAIKALETKNGWFEKMNLIYKNRRKIVWEILDALNCTYDKKSVGLFVWAKIPVTETATSLTDKLLYEKQIFITPGSVFGSNGKEYIRISLCVDIKNLTEVTRRLKK